jgi:hypothetical protein
VITHLSLKSGSLSPHTFKIFKYFQQLKKIKRHIPRQKQYFRPPSSSLTGGDA